jgi:hypothetical protein
MTKQLLTKLVYGSETNPKKTPFGILPGIIKGDSIANNGGWFNMNGEKIGSGDLSMKDLEIIGKHISSSEVFLVLSEYDAAFNIPSHLDRSEPGKDYVINKALWVISKDAAGPIILRVSDKDSKVSECEKDNVKYTKIPRKDFKKSIQYPIMTTSSSDTKKKVLTEEDIIKDQLYKIYQSQFIGKQAPPTIATNPVPSATNGLIPKANPAPTMAKSTGGVQPSGKFLTPSIPGLKKSSTKKKSSTSP